MQLGEFRLTTISGGRFRVDGGTMFGVVPKPLWSRAIAADETNTIPQATNCVLVETGQLTILIDTGFGSKLSVKQQRLLQVDMPDPLATSLSNAGIAAAGVDLVILSHLHFDHAGGATVRDEAGELRATFPGAEYVVQRREWELASADLPELRDAYPTDNFLPLQKTGRLRLIDGDGEIAPGVNALLTGGHTEGHMAIRLESGGEVAVYLGDICPSRHHLPINYCTSFDTHLLQTRRVKRELLGQLADHNWLALFDHDPDVSAARIGRNEQGRFLPLDVP